jgi:predicted outer membrane repeat protein
MGGAIGVDSLHAINTTFTNNNALESGGAVFAGDAIIHNCTFIGSESGDSDQGKGGGAVYAGNANITDTSFINCTTHLFGGAVLADSATITDTSFTNCTTSGPSGGALQLGNAILTNCIFAGCHTPGDSGGAVNAGSANITNTSFINCSSSEPGGALNVRTCVTPGGAVCLSNATLTNCTFAGCRTAGAPGGAIYSYSGQVTLEGCTFVVPEDLSRGQNDNYIDAPNVACRLPALPAPRAPPAAFPGHTHCCLSPSSCRHQLKSCTACNVQDEALDAVAEAMTQVIAPRASKILLPAATRMLNREILGAGKSSFVRKKLKNMIEIAISASILMFAISGLGKVKKKMAKKAELLKKWVLQRREKHRASLAVEQLKQSPPTEGALRGDSAAASPDNTKEKKMERTKLAVQKLFATGPFSKGVAKAK